MYRCIWLLAGLISLYATPAFSTLNLEKTRIVFYEQQQVVKLPLKNQTPSKLFSKIWIENEQGEDVSDDLVALPAQMMVGANEEQMVGIMLIDPKHDFHCDKETLLYFNTLEMPAEALQTHRADYVVQIRYKLFFRPKTLHYQGSSIWQRDLTVRRTATKTVILRNPSPYYVVLAYIGRDGRQFVDEDFQLNLAPGAEQTIPLVEELPNDFSLGYINDSGSLTLQQYHCDQEQCRLL